MSERPRHLTHVVRRRPSGQRGRGDGPSLRSAAALGLLGLTGLALALLVLRSGEVDTTAAAAATAAFRQTQGAAALPATPTPEPPQPTSTFLAPSPTPTRLAATGAGAAPTQFYTSQTGDTLSAIAARFGVNPDDIQLPFGFTAQTTLNPGQRFIIPSVLDPGAVSPGVRLVPDADVVFSASAASFDPAAFARELGGYLAGYRGFADGLTRSGGDIVLSVGRQHSINPRLLLGLLEHLGGWVSNPAPTGTALTRPLGYAHPYRDDLTPQLSWAANQLAIGYYGWRAGTLTELTFPDGSRRRLNPALNAGTVAVQYFFAQVYSPPEWDAAVGPDGFPATYARLFGDPFARELPTLIPGDLAQPPLALPFQRGTTWYFSGGPHGAWENGGAQAALDFAPASIESGCAQSDAWVAAAAAGQIVRSERNAVVLDLDGDGRESTGWVIFYFHIAEQDRIAAGTFVEQGDRIGHPSCEGGRATGTHVHLARKYNGEWIPAYGPLPFNLEGWVAERGEGEYLGILTRDGQTIRACACTAAWTAITAGR